MNRLDFIWLEVTSGCNLTCTHCYSDSGPLQKARDQLSYDDWVSVLKEAAECGCRKVQFIGGEPTTFSRLSDLVEKARTEDFELIEVFTNATFLTSRLVDCLRENRAQVATSFYSDDPSVHDRITRVDGSWNRTVNGIRTILDAGIPLRVGVIETKENESHSQLAIQFLNSLGVQNIGFDRERTVGRGRSRTSDLNRLDHDELCGQCWSGKLCVTSSGSVWPCVFARKVDLGDIRHGLRQILESDKLSDFRRAVHDMSAQRKQTNLMLKAGMSPRSRVAELNDPCWPEATLPPIPQPTPPPAPCAPDATPGPFGPH